MRGATRRAPRTSAAGARDPRLWVRPDPGPAAALFGPFGFSDPSSSTLAPSARPRRARRRSRYGRRRPLPEDPLGRRGPPPPPRLLRRSGRRRTLPSKDGRTHSPHGALAEALKVVVFAHPLME